MMKAIIPASTWALEEKQGAFPLAWPPGQFSQTEVLGNWVLSVFPAGWAESEGQLVLERVQDSPPPVASPRGDSVRVSTAKAPSSPGGSVALSNQTFPLESFHPGKSSLAALQGNGLWVQSSSACAFRVCESLTEQSLPSERFEELLTGPSPGEVMK
uniref:Uncharacterized protein n=1 Tax=Cercocebus atys TaxID=9531 RepID=A0A2K5KS29_CERAT